MNLATLEVDKNTARKAFLEYKGAVRERHDAEDEMIMRGYREIVRGRQLLRLPDVIEAGGIAAVSARRSWPSDRVTVMVPRIAVCRADEDFATVRVGDDSLTFRGRRRDDDWPWRSTQRAVRVETRMFGDLNSRERPSAGFLEAMVPIVPPALRPRSHLRNFHILWEAEWKQAKAPAPKDPALLKHVGGDLYAVVAVWDLTEIERAVLAQRS